MCWKFNCRDFLLYGIFSIVEVVGEWGGSSGWFCLIFLLYFAYEIFSTPISHKFSSSEWLFNVYLTILNCFFLIFLILWLFFCPSHGFFLISMIHLSFTFSSTLDVLRGEIVRTREISGEDVIAERRKLLKPSELFNCYWSVHNCNNWKCANPFFKEIMWNFPTSFTEAAWDFPWRNRKWDSHGRRRKKKNMGKVDRGWLFLRIVFYLIVWIKSLLSHKI